MNKFEIGDCITGNDYADFSITTRHWVGRVVYTDGVYMDTETVFLRATHPEVGGSNNCYKPGHRFNHLEESKFDLCDSLGNPLTRFEVGDLITGAPHNTYKGCTKDFVGVVLEVTNNAYLRFQHIKPHTGDSMYSVARKTIETLPSKDFIRYTGLDPHIVVPKVIESDPGFKVGDLVTGILGTTEEGIIGRVTCVFSDKSMCLEVIQGGEKVKLSGYEDTYPTVFKKYTLYRGPIITFKPKETEKELPKAVKIEPKVATKKSKESGPPKYFIEGISVVIAYKRNYYDVLTEDYRGKSGIISGYYSYSTGDSCWIVLVSMNDGEMLEVLENEIVGYVDKRVKEVVEVKPIDSYSTYKASIDPIYQPTQNCDRAVGKPNLEFDLTPIPIVLPVLQFTVSPFDISPKSASGTKLVF